MAYDLTLDGIVIGELPLNDNDKLLTLITSKRGKMVVLAKGIKAINSKRSAGAQLFCYSTFGFVKREERLYLDAIEVKDSFQGLRDDLESVALASYFAEVASSVCVEENDESEMLRLLLNCIYALANLKNKPKWMIKAVFELKSMCIQGFAPYFSDCCICGKDNRSALRNIIFELLEGGFVCNDCSSAENFEISKDGYLISADTYKALKYICESEQGRMLAFDLPSDKIAEFSQICELYITIHTEKKYKTLDYYKQMK